jgi:hypothetical protein
MVIVEEQQEVVDEVERFARREGAGTNESHRIIIATELLAP